MNCDAIEVEVKNGKIVVDSAMKTNVKKHLCYW